MGSGQLNMYCCIVLYYYLSSLQKVQVIRHFWYLVIYSCLAVYFIFVQCEKSLHRVVLKAGIRNLESGITGHCFTNTGSKNSLTFIKANLRPTIVCLGLIRPKVSFYECLGVFTLCIGKTMTCDSRFRIRLLGQPPYTSSFPLSSIISLDKKKPGLHVFTPFALHLRKINIHLCPNLFHYGHYTLINTNITFICA